MVSNEELKELKVGIDIDKDRQTAKIVERDIDGNVIHESNEMTLETIYSLGQTMRLAVAKHLDLPVDKCSKCKQYHIVGMTD